MGLAVYRRKAVKWVVYRRIIPEFSERMIANPSDCGRQPVDRSYRSYAYAEKGPISATPARPGNSHVFRHTVFTHRNAIRFVEIGRDRVTTVNALQKKRRRIPSFFGARPFATALFQAPDAATDFVGPLRHRRRFCSREV
jgi:hypothetical protein